MHQGEANAEVLPSGVNRQGTEQKCRRSIRADLQRPEADRSRKFQFRIAHHQRQALDSGIAFAQPVG